MDVEPMRPEDGIRYVVDSSLGRYAWQTLVRRFEIENVDERDLRIIEEGPDHPDYWEAVDLLIEFGRVRDVHNDAWIISPHPDDGGIILYHPDFSWSDWE